MLETNPCVNSVPQNPNNQRSVAPGQQRVIYLMVNESLILCKRQVRVARNSADREIFAAWAFSQKVWAVPQAGDKVKEITFDLLWHSYNYLDPGEGPFLWLGYCHLIFHLKDVKAISLLADWVRCWKFLNHLANLSQLTVFLLITINLKKTFKNINYLSDLFSNGTPKSTIIFIIK